MSRRTHSGGSMPLDRRRRSIGGRRVALRKNPQDLPWLGVLSIDYIFESQGVESSISTFYDGLVEWKNADYLPYLQECGAFTDELAAHTAFASPVLTQDLHASLVRQLRLRVQPYINPRPAMYVFHDFRD